MDTVEIWQTTNWMTGVGARDALRMETSGAQKLKRKGPHGDLGAVFLETAHLAREDSTPLPSFEAPSQYSASLWKLSHFTFCKQATAEAEADADALGAEVGATLQLEAAEHWELEASPSPY